MKLKITVLALGFALSQTGTIPEYAQSLQFKSDPYYSYNPNPLPVSLLAKTEVGSLSVKYVFLRERKRVANARIINAKTRRREGAGFLQKATKGTKNRKERMQPFV